MSENSQHLDFSSHFVGLDFKAPLLNGNLKRYVNFDNAASTPPLKSVQEAVNNCAVFYSSVHRGTGYKSQLSTHLYEEARKAVYRFVNANPEEHAVIFAVNTTAALNKLAQRFPFTPERNIVLTTSMEHHSNDLPWRGAADTIHLGLTPDGRLDEADFDAKLSEYGDRLALVAVTGASNVTGFILPIHHMAEKTHTAGGMFAADCAQLAPHRRIDMRPLDDPGHLDFVAISAHKMYAPYGSGALIGRRDIFESGDPDTRGGGTVEIVTLDDVVWAPAPERDEAGSPNVIGAVALAAAIETLMEFGMGTVAQHEADLTAYTLRRFTEIPGIRIMGDTNPDNAPQRLGVIPFLLDGVDHFLAAAILGHEYSIGVRNGCFCAHPYLLHLLGLDAEEAQQVRTDILSGDKRNMPGLVRVSFGLYNTFDEVDALVEALHKIVKREYQGVYMQNPSTGEYTPQGWDPEFERYFSIV